jgi:hypothetical protein
MLMFKLIDIGLAFRLCHLNVNSDVYVINTSLLKGTIPLMNWLIKLTKTIQEMHHLPILNASIFNTGT